MVNITNVLFINVLELVCVLLLLPPLLPPLLLLACQGPTASPSRPRGLDARCGVNDTMPLLARPANYPEAIVRRSNGVRVPGPKEKQHSPRGHHNWWPTHWPTRLLRRHPALKRDAHLEEDGSGEGMLLIPAQHDD